MLFMAGLMRIVFIGIVLYIIFLLVRFFQSIGKAASRAGTTRRERGTMVKDEICNMYLPREEAVLEVVDGKEHFFCSDDCRRKFLESVTKR
jgi:YHS domain-containing protein